MQGTQLRYAIKFVADMNKAVKFHRDMLGLKLKFESPGWSEFVTGETTLALHPASEKNPAGKVELGFTVADVEAFYRDMSAKGVLFSMPPKKQDFGGVLAQFVDSEGAPARRITSWALMRTQTAPRWNCALSSMAFQRLPGPLFRMAPQSACQKHSRQPITQARALLTLPFSVSKREFRKSELSPQPGVKTIPTTTPSQNSRPKPPEKSGT
jgi:predicted enzyme related to lactoylglutathione lyase